MVESGLKGRMNSGWDRTRTVERGRRGFGRTDEGNADEGKGQKRRGSFAALVFLPEIAIEMPNGKGYNIGQWRKLN